MTSPPAWGNGLKRLRDNHNEGDSSTSLPKHQRRQSTPRECSIDAASPVEATLVPARSSQPLSSGLADEAGKVFRLRHIPRWSDSVTGVQVLLKDLLSLDAGTSISIHSVACSPYDPAERIATLSLSKFPAALTAEKSHHKAGKEWRFETCGPDGGICFPTLDTHFLGFTPLHREKDSDCTTDIIALSGLNGHAFGSFKEKGGAFMWLRDALSKDMPQARILIYGYDTSILGSNSFQSLRDLGIQLRGGLRSIRQDESGSSTHRPMVLIGHSLGGTVIKDAIIQMTESDEIDKANLKSIYGILFFGVPNQGMAIESLLPMAGQNPSQHLLHTLRKGSEVLRYQQEQFPLAFNFQDSVIISFYETLESPTAVEVNGRWTMDGPSAVLVDASSATHGRHWESKHPFIYPVNRSHSNMVKFTGNDDPVYRVVLERLKLLEAGARNIIPQRHMNEDTASLATLSEEQQACLKSLAFPEQLWRQDEITQARLNGTCKWVTQHPQYSSWLQQSSGVLWIQGKPGAGKSTLMKYIVEDMEEGIQWRNGLVATFFVHGRGSPHQREPIGIFRALLNQLLAYLPEELSTLTKIFQERSKKMGEISKKWNWGEGDLRSFVESVLPKASCKRPITICIDALDECGKKSAMELAKYFSKLVQRASQLQGSLRVCCSCRHYPTLSLCQEFRIDVENENHEDINTFLQDYFKDLPSNGRSEIIEGISRRAQGVFQWAVLVAAQALELKMDGARLRKIMETIKEVPKELEDFYAALMADIDYDSRAQTVKLLQWVCFSREPLTTKELQHALAVDAYMNHRTCAQYKSGDYYTDTLEDLEKVVASLSRGLVQITNNRAQFIHQSAQDYFLNRGLQDLEGSDNYSVTALGHFQISRSCIRYMEMDDIAKYPFPIALLALSHADSIAQIRKLNDEFPLARYAIRFLQFHLQAVEAEQMPQNDLWDLFRWPNDGNIAATWTKCAELVDFERERGWSFGGSRLVHLLAAAGINSALDHLLENHGHNQHEVDPRDRELRTPLYWALWNKHTSTAHKLLSTGTVDLGPFGPFGQTALHLVAMGGDISLVHEIIRMGAPINLENEYVDSPLSLAIHFWNKEAVEVLVKAGAFLDVGEGTSGGITHYTVKDRNSELLNLALTMGASADMMDQDGQTALFKAVIGFPATEKVMYQLIEAGARLDFFDFNGDTPLSCALLTGNENLVQSLIDHGATLGLDSASGEIALTSALDSGNEALTALLLEQITEDG